MGEGFDPNLRKKTLKIVRILKKYYPEAHCELNYSNPLELLIATILSAQCTDKRVNMVTPALFKKYPRPQDFAAAKIKDLEKMIHSTGFYKNKAKNIKACCEQIQELHKGKVPKTMEELHALPGVGRKTANVVLGNAFGIPGMVVDTHVTRLTNKLGLTEGKNAVVLEKKLQLLVKKEDWTQFSHLIISHGRSVCKARRPECSKCCLEELCPSSEA